MPMSQNNPQKDGLVHEYLRLSVEVRGLVRQREVAERLREGVLYRLERVKGTPEEREALEALAKTEDQIAAVAVGLVRGTSRKRELHRMLWE